MARRGSARLGKSALSSALLFSVRLGRLFVAARRDGSERGAAAPFSGPSELSSARPSSAQFGSVQLCRTRSTSAEIAADYSRDAGDDHRPRSGATLCAATKSINAPLSIYIIGRQIACAWNWIGSAAVAIAVRQIGRHFDSRAGRKVNPRAPHRRPTNLNCSIPNAEALND